MTFAYADNTHNNTVAAYDLWSLLLTWFNFNSSMDK